MEFSSKIRVIYFFIHRLKYSVFSKADYSWTHIKDIPSSGLLVSLHHSVMKSANMEIFDISQRGKVKKVYSFEEVLGSKYFSVSLS